MPARFLNPHNCGDPCGDPCTGCYFPYFPPVWVSLYNRIWAGPEDCCGNSTVEWEKQVFLTQINQYKWGNAGEEIFIEWIPFTQKWIFTADGESRWSKTDNPYGPWSKYEQLTECDDFGHTPEQSLRYILHSDHFGASIDNNGPVQSRTHCYPVTVAHEDPGYYWLYQFPEEDFEWQVVWSYARCSTFNNNPVPNETEWAEFTCTKPVIKMTRTAYYDPLLVPDFADIDDAPCRWVRYQNIFQRYGP